VGRGATRQSYVPVVARHFLAARTRGASIRGNHPRYADLHHLSSWAGERMSAAELIGLAESCPPEGWWGIYTFHGVNQGHLPISEYDLCRLLDYLAINGARFWVAPLIEVAQYIVQTG
jgi:hypothetical protein